MLRERVRDNKVYEEALRLEATELEAEVISTRLKDVDDVTGILNYSKDDIVNTELLVDCNKASDIIYRHLKNKSNILSFTDCDADGISSASVIHRAMIEYFKHPVDKFNTIINKKIYGNGMNDTILEKILTLDKENKIDLLILADHGSANDKYFKILKEKTSMEIVVTDHHEIPTTGKLKYVDAFVNPMRDDDEYCKRNISGCSVIYLVLKDVINRFNSDKLSLGINDYGNSLLAITAITVLSDAMSLIEPKNRYILSEGLDIINNSNDIMWKIFKEFTREPVVTEKTIGFLLAPLINATNRLGYPEIAFKFMTSTTKLEIDMNLKRMIEFNNERKEVEARLTYKGYDAAKKYFKESSLIILQESHPGISGLVSQTIGEAFNRPTFTFTINKNGDYTGSGRAIIPTINLKEILDTIAEKDETIFVDNKKGGHKGAAGCTISKNRLISFAHMFDDLVTKSLEENNETVEKIDYYDKELDLDNLNNNVIEQLESLKPFGREFEEPVLYSRNIYIKQCTSIGKPVMHHGLKIASLKTTVRAFYPKSGFKISCKKIKDKVIGILYSPQKKEYKGKKSIEVTIKKIVD